MHAGHLRQCMQQSHRPRGGQIKYLVLFGSHEVGAGTSGDGAAFLLRNPTGPSRGMLPLIFQNEPQAALEYTVTYEAVLLNRDSNLQKTDNVVLPWNLPDFASFCRKSAR